MDEEAKTNDESWAVEPPKKTASQKRKALRIVPPKKTAGKKRRALRIALIVAVTCGILAILGKTYTTYKEKADKAYDAYCMEKYKFDAGLATASGWTQCSCGHREEIGYIYVGGPLPKPRPSAPQHIVESYNRKMKQIEVLKSREFSHDCPNSGL